MIIKRILKVSLLVLLFIYICIAILHFKDSNYYIDGYYHLEPGENIVMEIREDQISLNRFTEMHLDIVEGEQLYLTGSKLWISSTTEERAIGSSDTLYYYDIEKQSIEKHIVHDGSLITEDSTSHPINGISFKDKGIRFYSKDYTLFLITEKNSQSIRISNNSDKPVVFSAQIVYR